METEKIPFIGRGRRRDILKNFRRTNKLIRSKMLGFLPTLIATHLSFLTISSVDGVVVGNIVGTDAMTSVHIFYPATIMIGVLSAWLASGISVVLSLSMGENDKAGILRARDASKRLMIAGVLLISILQIPIVYLIIGSYALSENMRLLTWQYAIGIMIASPLGLVSNVGVYQLQIAGKMDVLFKLTVAEGAANIILDLLFVGPMSLGIAGAGYGTAYANALRCTLTVLYISGKTEFYQTRGIKAKRRDYQNILRRGLPEGANTLMRSIPQYFMVLIILDVFGESGCAVFGVCSFTLMIAFSLISSVQGSMRPLAGVFYGAKDLPLVHALVHFCIWVMVWLIGFYTLLCEFFPGILFRINGVSLIPDEGILMLRIFALHFLFKAINTVFRVYYSVNGSSSFATVSNIVGYATLPIFAYLLGRYFPGIYLWISYTMTEVLILLLNLNRYRKDRHLFEQEIRSDKGMLYLTVTPEDAAEASAAVEAYAKANGYNRMVGCSVALCVEEMAAYAKASRNSGKVNIEIVIHFTPQGATFLMFDDGEYLALDKYNELEKLVTDNYGLLLKVARTADYQYVTSMNHTVFYFENKEAGL